MVKIKSLLSFPWEPRRFVLQWTEDFDVEGEDGEPIVVSAQVKIEIRKPKGRQDYCLFLHQNSALLFTGEPKPVRVWESKLFPLTSGPYGKFSSGDWYKCADELRDQLQNRINLGGVESLLNNKDFGWKPSKR